MAYNDIEAIAKMMKAEEHAKCEYANACEKNLRKQMLAESKAIQDYDEEAIDPDDVGFDYEEQQNAVDAEADRLLAQDDEDPYAETIDMQECGFLPESKKDLNNHIHSNNDNCTIAVDVTKEDDFDLGFAGILSRKVNTVQITKTSESDDHAIFSISGKLKDVKKAYAIYCGYDAWTQIENADDDDYEYFCDNIEFDDGDTLAEADYREALSHGLDFIDVKASTANNCEQDAVEMSIVEKLQRRIDACEKRLNEHVALNESDGKWGCWVRACNYVNGKLLVCNLTKNNFYTREGAQKYADHFRDELLNCGYSLFGAMFDEEIFVCKSSDINWSNAMTYDDLQADSALFKKFSEKASKNKDFQNEDAVEKLHKALERDKEFVKDCYASKVNESYVDEADEDDEYDEDVSDNPDGYDLQTMTLDDFEKIYNSNPEVKKAYDKTLTTKLSFEWNFKNLQILDKRGEFRGKGLTLADKIDYLNYNIIMKPSLNKSNVDSLRSQHIVKGRTYHGWKDPSGTFIGDQEAGNAPYTDWEVDTDMANWNGEVGAHVKRNDAKRQAKADEEREINNKAAAIPRRGHLTDNWKPLTQDEWSTLLSKARIYGLDRELKDELYAVANELKDPDLLKYVKTIFGEKFRVSDDFNGNTRGVGDSVDAKKGREEATIIIRSFIEKLYRVCLFTRANVEEMPSNQQVRYALKEINYIIASFDKLMRMKEMSQAEYNDEYNPGANKVQRFLNSKYRVFNAGIGHIVDRIIANNLLHKVFAKAFRHENEVNKWYRAFKRGKDVETYGGNEPED